MSALLHLLTVIGIVFNGLFAGMSLTAQLVLIPVFRVTQYPVEGWAVFLTYGTRLALTSIFMGTLGHAVQFYSTRQSVHLLCAVLSFAAIPWTFLVMDSIYGGLRKSVRDRPKHKKELIAAYTEQWYAKQWFRIVASIAALGLGIYTLD
ncbi:hypothetical protein BX666DRAFT_1879150 [Dichotomocladium elegans]|nr:hypothetical protein BX666DRAFT_1879150 [Dichotomocladium elegans]